MDNNSIWVKTNDNNIEYTWEISIGKYGGFIYRNISNQERNYEYINQNDISDIDECEKDLEYLNINECIGVHSTSVDLPNIKAGSNNEPSVKIYNENEVPLSIDDVKEDTNIISILEIQGIKFTSRNFQIEIELRQAMVLDNEPLFDNCLIKTNHSNKTVNLVKDNKESLEENNLLIVSNTDTKEFGIELDLGKETEEINEAVEQEVNEALKQEVKEEINEEIKEHVKEDVKEEVNDLTFDIQELPIEELEDNTELKEMDLGDSLEDDLESITNDPITLKNPNEVYYQLYKEAREKAKLAKRTAIIAYLEAKNIKKTYMIESLDESESDIDAEIDEVSESELEGL